LGMAEISGVVFVYGTTTSFSIEGICRTIP